MGTRTRSLVSVIALAFAILFFGPTTSNAQAWVGHGSGHFAHSQYHGGHGRHGVRHGYGYTGRFGWGYGPYVQPYYLNPYRTVRVFVAFPFPHWVFRQVYYGPRVAAPYVSPY